MLDQIPEDVPVLIDEAYHHFVGDASYATSVPYVIEGRQVIVARTFSKIAALAGMRLGYALAPKTMIQKMRLNSTGSINALVRYGGVAALKDTESQVWVKKTTITLREKTIKDLASLGYQSIPSDANFFMVHQTPGRAGDRRVQEERRAGRASVPANERASPRVGWHRGRDEPVHGRVQGHHDTEDGNEDGVGTRDTGYFLLVLVTGYKNPRDASLALRGIPRVLISSKQYQ